MSIFYKRSAPELITGAQYDTLRFHLEPTRIGCWFGYEPVTREYLTNGGIWFFDSSGGKIDDAATHHDLHCVYQSEKMKAAIERNRPLNITITNRPPNRQPANPPSHDTQRNQNKSSRRRGRLPAR